MHLAEIRSDIHPEFKYATTDEERGVILAIHKTVMDHAERHIGPADIAAFRKVRTEDYNLLLISESLVGENVSPELLERATRREVAAGRMSADNDLRQLAVAGDTILTHTPRAPSIWDRVRDWMRRS